jgi:uncharacterized protein YqjF (DUF2071 family)
MRPSLARVRSESLERFEYPLVSTSMTPAPSPATRNFLTAHWKWLAVFNYEIDPAILAPLTPRGTELDFDAQLKTYVSIVGFLFRDTRLLGWSIPGHVHFEELNLRFYVQRRMEGEIRRGVVFVKELVPRRAIATVARWCYNENYVVVPMRHTLTPGEAEQGVAPQVKYEYRYRGEWNSLRVACHAEPNVPALDSHEAFILEHYWGYCRQRNGGTLEYRVDHPRWTVWPAAEVEIDCDFAAIYGPEFATVLSRKPESAFVADGSAVSVARPTWV